MIKLIADDDGKTVEYILKEGINVVGRDEKCDIVIDHHQISRNHVSVIVGPEGIVVQDLNSRNGTFVNGLKVTNTAQIKHGDVLALGKYLLKCIVVETAPLEEEPPTPVTVEPPEAADTLPFKGKYAKMMSGGTGDALPAKFDPSHYQIAVHGQRIIVTDPTTNQAIELYRGTPDAAIVDKLIEDRRKREQRNLIIGVGGGLVALALLLILAFVAIKPEQKQEQPKFDAPAYYTRLNKAVAAFESGGKLEDINAILDDAEKTTGWTRSVAYHIQLKNIFRLKRKLAADPSKGTNWSELLQDLQPFEDNPLPENVDAGVTRAFIDETRKVAEREESNWELLDNARTARANYDERKAIKQLQEIIKNRNSVYYNEAQKMIGELTVMFANKQLHNVLKPYNITLDTLGTIKEENLDMRQITQCIDVANDLLKNKFFRNEADRRALENFLELCQTFRETEQNKRKALELARQYAKDGKPDEAWHEVSYLENDRDPAISAEVAQFKAAYEKYVADIQAKTKLDEAIAAVKTAYNTGKGKEALDLITKYMPVLSSDEWLTLQNKISYVIGLYDEAQAALAKQDILTAKQKYELIISSEESPANFYREQARQFGVAFDQKSDDEKAKIYVAYAKQMLADGNYQAALENVQKADSVYKDGTTKAPGGTEVRVEIDGEGDKRLKEARRLHDSNQISRGIEVLKDVLDKHIYADDENGAAIANTCRNLRDSWEDELKNPTP